MSEELHQDPTQESEDDAAPIDPYQSFRDTRISEWSERQVPVLESAESNRQYYQASLENMQSFAEQFERKAEELRADIASKKSGLLSRVLHFKKIRYLESELGVTEHQARHTREQAQEREELVAAYSRIIEEERVLGDLMEEAQKENEAWDEVRRLEVLEEEGRRDLAALSKMHNTFFVHSLVNYAGGAKSGENTAVDRTTLDLADQFDVLLGLQPSISVSTLKENSAQRSYYGATWGVLLSGGRVKGGAVQDAFTEAHGLHDRTIDERFTSGDAIERAILERGVEHNELVLERPEVGGMYFRWEAGTAASLENGQEIHMDDPDMDGWWEQAKKAMARNVPIFLLSSDNTARMAYDIDPDTKTFKVAAEMRPQDMTDLPGIYKQHLGESERKKAVARVFDKVTGVLNEGEKEFYAPDGSEQGPDNSPYRLY